MEKGGWVLTGLLPTAITLTSLMPKRRTKKLVGAPDTSNIFGNISPSGPFCRGLNGRRKQEV